MDEKPPRRPLISAKEQERRERRYQRQVTKNHEAWRRRVGLTRQEDAELEARLRAFQAAASATATGIPQAGIATPAPAEPQPQAEPIETVETVPNEGGGESDAESEA